MSRKRRFPLASVFPVAVSRMRGRVRVFSLSLGILLLLFFSALSATRCTSA